MGMRMERVNVRNKVNSMQEVKVMNIDFKCFVSGRCHAGWG